MPKGKCGLCSLCHRLVPIKRCMRTHIAKHILAKRLGKEDPLLSDGTIVGVLATTSTSSYLLNELYQMVGYALCGFCGRSGAPECRLTMTTTAKSTRFSSGCPFYDKFSLKSAETPTASSPCTNRPMRCGHPECSQRDPIWSYNMRDHILASHGQTAYDCAINEGRYLVTSGEIDWLQLDNMFVIPGRPRIVLPATPVQGTKRPLEGLTTSIVSDSPPTTAQQVDSEAHPVASGSALKRARTMN